MKHFTWDQIEAAVGHSGAGGQALHTHQFIVNWDKAPKCFRDEVRAGRDIAHLFDRDAKRLDATAKRLGVRVRVIERWGRETQHIDLCGAPLARALAECRRDARVASMSLFGG